MSIQFSGRVASYDRTSSKWDFYHETVEALLEWEHGDEQNG